MIPESLLTQWKAFVASLAALAVSITPVPAQVVQAINPNSPNVGVNADTSRNWAGYEVTNGTFTGVSGTWTIPSVTTSGHTSVDATWVGIGGVMNTDLVQAGTQNVIGPNGNVTSTAFYETLPDVSQTIPLVVHAGDSITATVTQESPGQWQVLIKDNTTGQNYQTTVSYNSSLTSAEWIEEAPSNGRSILPLDNFGSVSFSNASVIKNGSQQSISGSNGQAITMINTAGQTLASASALGSDSGSFTVTRTSAASTSPVPQYDRYPGSWRRQGTGVGGFTPYRIRRYRAFYQSTPSSQPTTSSITPGRTTPQFTVPFYRRRVRMFERE